MNKSDVARSVTDKMGGVCVWVVGHVPTVATPMHAFLFLRPRGVRERAEACSLGYGGAHWSTSAAETIRWKGSVDNKSVANHVRR